MMSLADRELQVTRRTGIAHNRYVAIALEPH